MRSMSENTSTKRKRVSSIAMLIYLALWSSTTSAAVSPRTFEVARLSASDGAAEHRFGKSLAVDGDIIAVAGDSVHVFRRVGATWVEEAKIRHPDWRRADFSSVGVPPPSPKTCSRSPPKPAATSIGGGMASKSSGSLCVPSSNSAASIGCGRM